MKLPRTRLAFERALSNAAVAGYMAGFRDRRNGSDMNKHQAAKIRRQMRAELARWMSAK